VTSTCPKGKTKKFSVDNMGMTCTGSPVHSMEVAEEIQLRQQDVEEVTITLNKAGKNVSYRVTPSGKPFVIAIRNVLPNYLSWNPTICPPVSDSHFASYRWFYRLTPGADCMPVPCLDPSTAGGFKCPIP